LHAGEDRDARQRVAQVGLAHTFELGAVHGAIAVARDAEFARNGQAGELVVARDHDRADAGDPALGDRELDLFAWRLGEGAALEIVRTETFTVLAMCQWFNVLNCQSASASALGLRIVRNRWLLGGLTLSVLLQALVLYAPPMNALFHTVPLPPESLLPLLGLASLVLWLEEARKLWARRMPRARP